MRIPINLAVILIISTIGLVLPFIVRDEYFIHSMIMVMYFAYLACAWNILCGYVGQISFGHALFCGVGAYTSVLLLINFGITPWLGMIAGGLISVVLAIIIGYPTMRLRGPYFALTTIAVAEVVRIWFENTDTLFGLQIKGAEGLAVPLVGNSWFLFQFESKTPYYYIILAMLIGALLITFWLENSKLGACLKAIRGDRDAAESLGINPTRYTLIAFSISAFLTALGGSYYAQFVRFINPDRLFGIELSIDMALMSIIGGQGTIFGPFLGSLFLTPIGELSRIYLGGKLTGLHLVIYSLILILAVLYLPKGILEPVKKVLGKIFRPGASKASKKNSPANKIKAAAVEEGYEYKSTTTKS